MHTKAASDDGALRVWPVRERYDPTEEQHFHSRDEQPNLRYPLLDEQVSRQLRYELSHGQVGAE